MGGRGRGGGVKYVLRYVSVMHFFRKTYNTCMPNAAYTIALYLSPLCRLYSSRG